MKSISKATLIAILTIATLSFTANASVQASKDPTKEWHAPMKFYPNISTITGVWEQTSNPYILFHMTLQSIPATTTTYYVDITYYVDYAHTITTTINTVEFDIIGGTQDNYTQYLLKTWESFYGVQSYTLVLAYP